MKLIKISFCAFVLAIVAIGCNKEQTIATIESKVFPATFSSSTPKVAYNPETLSFLWEPNDSLAILGVGAGNTINKFITEGSGSTAIFEGTVTIAPEATPTMWVGVNPFAAVSSFNSGNGNAVITVPSTQTGSVDDIGSYYISIAQSGNEIKNNSKEPETYDFSMNGPLTPFSSLIKFNIPASLKITEVKISASKAGNPTGIAGTETIKLNVGNVCKNAPVASDTAITLSRDGAEISGDVYAVVLPDAQVEGQARVYKSSAEALTIRIQKASGYYWQKQITINAANPITAGKQMNFGNIPETVHFTAPEPPAKPTLTYTAEKKLVASCTTPGVKFYYTLDSSCEPNDPTPACDELPEEGVEITSSQFIKVIAAFGTATEYVASEIAEANLMYWNKSMVETDQTGISLTTGGKYDITSWLYITAGQAVTSNADLTGISITKEGGVVKNQKTPAIYYNITSQTNGTATMFINGKRGAQRYYVPCINGNQNTSQKPTNYVFTQLHQAATVVGANSWVYNNNASDSGSAVFTIALFETGDVSFPKATCITPEFYPGNDGKMYVSTTTNATVYYTTSTSGQPADPTTSSSVFPADGLDIDNGTYIKAYAVKSGYDDSRISSNAVRSWSYTQLSTLFPGVDLTDSSLPDQVSTVDINVAPYVSDWLSFTSSVESFITVKCGGGYRYGTGSTTNLYWTNLLSGTAKLYAKATFSKTMTLSYRPSQSAEYSGTEMTSNTLCIAASSEVTAGEESRIYMSRDARLTKLVFVESFVQTPTKAISNQSFTR